MRIIKEKSVYGHISHANQSVHLTTKNFQGFKEGVNKEKEYSWFYILCVQGEKNEIINININPPDTTKASPNNQCGLAYYSLDNQFWHKITSPVLTDNLGLSQKFTFSLPSNREVLIANTIFYDYQKSLAFINETARRYPNIYSLINIGQSLKKNPLKIISCTRASRPQGRILITTGCHPAEPDFSISAALINYLPTPPAKELLNKYVIDIMPMQNPDGFVIKSCLTANGINLYWNFRHTDRTNCPEAYYLWKYIKKNPPLLYLDFHFYVTQFHRPSMPYLKPRQVYLGNLAKQTVRKIQYFYCSERKSGPYSASRQICLIVFYSVFYDYIERAVV